MQATTVTPLAALWRGNPLLTRGLGLSPVLVVSDRLATGLAMGIVMLTLLVTASAVVSACRSLIPPRVRFPFYALVLAGLATVVAELLSAASQPLTQALGVYPQVAAASALVLARLEDGAIQAPVPAAVADAAVAGAGCLWVAAILGAAREWLAAGAIGHGLWLPRNGEAGGLALAALPAGAFLLLAALAALHRRLTPAPVDADG